MQSYYDFKKDFPESSEEWLVKVEVSKTFDSLGIISLQFAAESYTGGAHGNYSVDFLNIDKARGEVLSNASFILEEERLVELSEKAFRAYWEIQPDSSLQDTGFWVNDGFFLPKSIGFEAENLILYYNNYEIAPYSAGPTVFKIPYSELEGVISFD